ncbi:ARM repeat superfamily protein isoform X2 [Wolffia australiana]
MAPLAAAPITFSRLTFVLHRSCQIQSSNLARRRRQSTISGRINLGSRHLSSLPVHCRAGNDFDLSSSSSSPYPDGETISRMSSGIPPEESYVGVFVEMLGLDKDLMDREQAVLTLWKYSQGGKHSIDEIMKFGDCIILVVRLLHSDSNLISEAAAGLLRNITAINLYMEPVVASGTIEEIAALLNRSDLVPENGYLFMLIFLEVKEQMLGILWNLSSDEECRMKIARSDIIPILVKCFDDEELKVKEAAGGVLSNMALSKSNHSTIVESGAIPKLAEILISNPEGHRILRNESRNVLLELSKDNYYKILTIEEGLVFVPLVGAAAYKSFRPVSRSWPSLPDGTEIKKKALTSRYGASELLLGLNYRDQSLDLEEMKMHAMIGRSQQQFLARIGAIEAEVSKPGSGSLPNNRWTVLSWVDSVARLVLILELEDVSAVKRAAWAIADSSINAHMRLAFKEAGAVKNLVQLLYHDDDEVREAAVHALERLSVSPNVYQILEAEMMMGPLVNMLKNGFASEKLTEKILSILSRVLDQERSVSAEVSTSEIERRNQAENQLSTAEVISRENIVTSDFLSCIVELLKAPSPNTQKMAASILEHLANCEEHVSIITDSGIESRLAGLFQGIIFTGDENSEDPPEINAVKAEEDGLAAAAASRLLTRLLDNETFCQHLNSSNFINILRKILKSDIPLNAKDWVAACLVKIESLASPGDDLKQPLDMDVVIYDTIPRLVEKMRTSGYEDEREAAVVELNSLVSKGIPEYARAVVKSGGLPLLVELVDQGSNLAVEAALAILYSLCMDDENHPAVVSAGAISVLRRVVRSERPQWNQALNLLRTLPSVGSDLS